MNINESSNKCKKVSFGENSVYEYPRCPSVTRNSEDDAAPKHFCDLGRKYCVRSANKILIPACNELKRKQYPKFKCLYPAKQASKPKIVKNFTDNFLNRYPRLPNAGSNIRANASKPICGYNNTAHAAFISNALKHGQFAPRSKSVDRNFINKTAFDHTCLNSKRLHPAHNFVHKNPNVTNNINTNPRGVPFYTGFYKGMNAAPTLSVNALKRSKYPLQFTRNHNFVGNGASKPNERNCRNNVPNYCPWVVHSKTRTAESFGHKYPHYPSVDRTAGGNDPAAPKDTSCNPSNCSNFKGNCQCAHNADSNTNGGNKAAEEQDQYIENNEICPEECLGNENSYIGNNIGENAVANSKRASGNWEAGNANIAANAVNNNQCSQNGICDCALNADSLLNNRIVGVIDIDDDDANGTDYKADCSKLPNSESDFAGNAFGNSQHPHPDNCDCAQKADSGFYERNFSNNATNEPSYKDNCCEINDFGASSAANASNRFQYQSSNTCDCADNAVSNPNKRNTANSITNARPCTKQNRSRSAENSVNDYPRYPSKRKKVEDSLDENVMDTAFNANCCELFNASTQPIGKALKNAEGQSSNKCDCGKNPASRTNNKNFLNKTTEKRSCVENRRSQSVENPNYPRYPSSGKNSEGNFDCYKVPKAAASCSQSPPPGYCDCAGSAVTKFKNKNFKNKENRNSRFKGCKAKKSSSAPVVGACKSNIQYPTNRASTSKAAAKSKSQKCAKKSTKTKDKLSDDDSDDEYEGGAVSKLSKFLSDIYRRRLNDIDTIANGDKELKTITYKEWGLMLLKMNENMLQHAEDLESDMAELLEKERIHVQMKNKEKKKMTKKLNRDICKLINVLSHAYKTCEWKFDCNFETFDKNILLYPLDPCRNKE